ncbi:hypothetical protein LZ24_00184 [Desulfobotulus alkaliphilus]|uniref:Uncharacterized protein n=1 Tax=Desulfobotulus alkaliphilus TaxID=622671 RepID=A0A562S7H7_9BACT|nr:hypothetical protein [Desulfobotulus alkaliphilus]TWI77375.1 hypothetical protein LZ24_00184 [Desulfobotulus alkaliphilus]
MEKSLPCEGVLDAGDLSAIRSLWRAVLARAIADSLMHRAIEDGSHPGTWKSQANRLELWQAFRWIEIAGPDFQVVCRLAGFDPETVRQAVRKANIRTLSTGPRIWGAASPPKPKRPRGRPRVGGRPF